jgi:hypothetical protein
MYLRPAYLYLYDDNPSGDQVTGLDSTSLVA